MFPYDIGQAETGRVRCHVSSDGLPKGRGLLTRASLATFCESSMESIRRPHPVPELLLTRNSADTTPRKVTLAILHGVVSPEDPNRLPSRLGFEFRGWGLG